MKEKQTGVDNPIKSSTDDNQRGIGVLELLFAASTIAATIAAVAMTVPTPKIPRTAGD